MILQACLNGARPAGSHHALPINAVSLAQDARRVVRCGANELHVHIRTSAGIETLEPDELGSTLQLLRQAVPGTLVGVSTGAWIETDPERTLALIGAWRALPDYASVNLNEPAAAKIIELLRKKGIGIEAGLASLADADMLRSLKLEPVALRVLVELDQEQTFAEAKTVADGIVDLLALSSTPKPILMHGFDATAWPMLEYATRLGFSVRMGLEDTLKLPDGSLAPGNCELVRAARQIMDRVLST